MYDVAKNKKTGCAFVDSTKVDKTVESYNPISGKAEIKAEFDDKADAEKAVEAGCLVIDDRGKS